MTTSPRDPADVVLAVAQGVCRLVAGGLDEAGRAAQVDALAALYAERTDVRHPFAPFGDTPLLSRAALRTHFTDGPARTIGAQRYEIADPHVHRTDDPEVVVFEFAYTGSADGREFRLPCIFVVRVRDGLIVESRDYTNRVEAARAFGRLGELAEALEREARSVGAAGH